MAASDTRDDKFRGEESRCGNYQALLACPAVMLFSITQVMIHYILPQVLITLVCESEKVASCFDPKVAERTASIIFYCELLTNFPGLFVVGFYGYISERYGRKIVMMLPCFGALIFILSMTLAWTLRSYAEIIIMVGAVVNGLSGGRNTFLMAAFCFASDITSIEIRSFVFSVLESGLFAARIFGPLTVAFLGKSGHAQFQNVLMIGAAVCGSPILWIGLVVPETIAVSETAAHRQLSGLNIFDPFTALRKMMKLIGWPEQLGNLSVAYAAVAYFICHTCAVGEYSIEVLYQKMTFQWTSETVALYGFLLGIVSTVSIVAVPICCHWIVGHTIRDIAWLQIGLWARTVFFTIFAFTTSTELLFAAMSSLLLFSGPIGPRTRAHMSASVTAKQQTELFVAFSALEGISALASPVFSLIYSETVAFYPGFVLLSIAAGYGVAAVLAEVGRWQQLRFERYDPIQDMCTDDKIVL